jgi:hypothetical protein
VKRSGGDESIRVAIHMCMEAMLGISLYTHLYLKLTKMLYVSYYLLCFFFIKSREEGRITSAWNRQGGGGRRAVWRRNGPNNVCTYE